MISQSGAWIEAHGNKPSIPGLRAEFLGKGFCSAKQCKSAMSMASPRPMEISPPVTSATVSFRWRSRVAPCFCRADARFMLRTSAMIIDRYLKVCKGSFRYSRQGMASAGTTEAAGPIMPWLPLAQPFVCGSCPAFFRSGLRKPHRSATASRSRNRRRWSRPASRWL